MNSASQLRVGLLAILLAAGCTTHNRTITLGASPSLTLEKSSRDTLWIATWRFARPVRELRFQRPAGHFRQGVFTPLTAGYEIARDGDTDIIRTTGSPSSEIAVSFPAYSAHLDKEYEFFSRFSDGAVTVYTGHLLARPVYAEGSNDCDSCFLRSIRLVPPAGSAVIIGGKRSSSPVTWIDASGEGTYAYFGSASPLASDDMISIIDRELPQWLQQRSSQVFPKLFDYYRGRFGIAPPVRPTVYFSYSGNKSSGMSSGGGTLPGVIQLNVEGEGWNSETHAGLSHLLHFLAHESAHIWNGEIAHYSGDVDSWMHEGSADALAERSLVALGVIDSAEYFDYQTNALNSCLQGISSAGLRSAAKRSSQLYYSCGNVIALITEQAADRRKTKDLFDFWKDLIAASRSHRGIYSADDYFSIMAASGASSAISDIRIILDSGANAPTMRAMLERRGAVIAEVAVPPAGFAQTLSRQAFFTVLGDNCTGRYGFRTDRGGFIVDDGASCKGLAGGSVVNQIGGHDVLREGHLVWDYIHDQCAASQPVVLSTAAAQVSFECSKKLPARPAYLKIESIKATH